jgi:hypothetical protein
MICAGFSMNALEYSSLNRVNPPKPAGMFTVLSAMILLEVRGIKGFCWKPLKD